MGDGGPRRRRIEAGVQACQNLSGESDTPWKRIATWSGFTQPDAVDDPLTEVLRTGARQLLAQAVELEVEAFLAERAGLKLTDGRVRLVRHGHAPERAVQTGIGAVAVSRPKVRDRGAGEGEERIRFTSTILPR